MVDGSLLLEFEYGPGSTSTTRTPSGDKRYVVLKEDEYEKLIIEKIGGPLWRKGDVLLDLAYK